MSSGTFIDECLSGTAFLDDIDDWVERWHSIDTELSLNAFLGFTDEEAALWAERPEALRFIVAAHRYEQPVTAILSSRDDFALAARAPAASQAAEVLEWLRVTDRL